MRYLWIILLTLCLSPISWAAPTINVYTWADYIPQSVIEQFENETGIQVNVTEFASNDALYTKMKSLPKGYYDVIFPSSNYAERMSKEHMLRRLDHKTLPNLRYLAPKFRHAAYDPANHYTAPYLWGTTGIVVNDRYHDPNNINSWSDLWHSQYRNQLLILNEMPEAFAVAHAKLGQPINSQRPTQIKRAYQALKKLQPNIRLYKGDGSYLVYMSGDATIGMGWSGGIYLAKKRNPHLHYIYPKEVIPLWLDCMAIPRRAPHPKLAERFINFIMRPAISKRIAMDQGFSTPNQRAMNMLPKKLKNNRLINPGHAILKRARIQRYLGKAHTIYARYWEKIKLGLD